MNAAPHRIDRRRFVTTCVSLCACGVAGACASIVTRPVPVLDGRVRLSLRDFPDLLRPGGGTSVLPAGARDRLFVLAIADGSFAAISSRCTHRGCAIDVVGEHLVCPCHGSMYDREGRVVRGPAERSLERYPVTVAGDVLEIVMEVRS